MMRFALPASIVGLALLAVSPASGAESVDFGAINRAVIDGQIIPGYRQLAAATAGLDKASGSFCGGPTEDRLSELRQEHNKALDAWMAVQHVRFGPVELFMRNFRIQFWPDKRGRSGKHLSGLLAEADPEAVSPDSFANGSVAVQGFPALERLLFDDDGTLAAFTDPVPGAFRCRVLTAITANLATIATELLEDWTGGDEPFRDRLVSPDPDGRVYASHKDVAAALLNDFATALQGIRDLKLLPALGESLESARPRLAESWRSRRSMGSVVTNLEAVRTLYSGADGIGLGLALADDGAVDRQIRGLLDSALDTARSVSLPLHEAVSDPAARDRVVALAAVIRALQETALPALVAALDMPVGFNSLDGD